VSGASAEGEINHWPGFVDALTTIIMVVTFLLIILGATVFVLSQKIVKQVRAEITQSEGKSRGAPADIDKLRKLLAAAQAEIASMKNSQQKLQSPEDAEDGLSIADTDDLLRQDQIVKGDERLSIRTRETDDTLKLRVAAEEKPEKTTGSDVRVAELLLKIEFAPDALEYTDDAKKQIAEFLERKPDIVKKGTFEIWSFAPSVTTISGAQRSAYYRALLMRNMLIEKGVSANRIKAQVRVDDQLNRGHVVKVVLKP
jgi:hypothetical protein